MEDVRDQKEITVAPNDVDAAVIQSEKGNKPNKPNRQDEEHILPHNNMPVVCFALALTVFLVCAPPAFPLVKVPDLFIGCSRSDYVLFIPNTPNVTNINGPSVATSLPTIVEQLGGGNNYAWIGR